MMAPIKATPATADPAAMPIVRELVAGDELDDELPLSPSSSSLLDEDDDEPVGADADFVASMLAMTNTVPVPVAEVAVVVGAADVVSVMSVSSFVRTQILLPLLQVYPKGQHPDPHVGSWPVRFVVWTARVGYAVAFWTAMLQVMGSIWEQSSPSGQHSTVVAPARDRHESPLAQQKPLGSPLPHWT